MYLQIWIISIVLNVRLVLKIQLIWRFVADFRVSQQANYERRIRGRLTLVFWPHCCVEGGINLFIKKLVDSRCNGIIRLYGQYCEEDNNNLVC